MVPARENKVICNSNKNTLLFCYNNMNLLIEEMY